MTSSDGARDRDERLARLDETARLQVNLLADIAAGRPVDPGPVAESTSGALALLAGDVALDEETREALRRVLAMNGAIAAAIDGALRETGRRLEEVRRASRLASELDARRDEPKRDWTA